MAGLALRALLAGSIDYAGCFPPANLPLSEAVANFLSYRQGPYSWMLGRFVVRAQEVHTLPFALDGALTVVGADHQRATSVEVPEVAQFDKPTYCEVNVEKLDAVVQVGSFAKLRTGGLHPAQIPDASTVAEFLAGCNRRKLPFKATAGLHHPIRGNYQLTYSSDSPCGCMHGFLNLLYASAWLWSGGDPSLLIPILEETEHSAFTFHGDRAQWQGTSLSAAEIEQARRHFFHSFGSCSFVEPVEDLRNLGYL